MPIYVMLYRAFEHAKQIVLGHESSFPAEAMGFLSSFCVHP
jgi:hypothetical protein